MTDNIESALTPISNAQRMLAEAKTIPEFVQLRDYATTAKAWAKTRGMGVDAENEASEVILRSERQIGLILNEMAAAGQRQPQGGQGGPASGLPSLAEMGFDRKRVHEWSRLALLPDELLEDMLRTAREKGERLAKHNFYARGAAIANPNSRRGKTIIETGEDPGFATFRAGAYNLLGWQVGDDGTGSFTKNGLLMLPDDELVTVATIIKAMVVAYNEAKGARG